jgi:protein-tyrosine phosphatase
VRRPAQWLLALPPLRAWLGRRARRAWRDAGEPLILCYGNINRSAFAAALAAARGHPGARSAGFYPEEGRSSPEATVACAARYGVDLSAHRSRRVRREELSSADAIFVFDLQNVARVAALDPGALARIHLVGALDEEADVLIADPHGRGDAVLAQTLARIARAVEHEGSSR